MNSDTKATLAHCRQLVGRKIVDVVYSGDEGPDNEFEFVGLVFDDDAVAWILCDPEGNGPGHLDIERSKPVYTKAKKK